jgi:glyoxylase-like metal-dependent hydrolase (beta-lactamase superfamily II)
MIRWRVLLVLLLSGCCLLPMVAAAGAIESSYRTARKVIDGALLYSDMREWLERPVPVLIEARGHYFPAAERQGLAADDATSTNYHETWAYDPTSGWVGREYRRTRPDGTSEWLREIYPGGDEQILIDLDRKRAVRQRGGDLAARRDSNLRRFTPLLLQEALQHPESLRSMGRYGPFNSVLGKLPWRYGIHVNETALTDMRVQSVSTSKRSVRRFFEIPGDIPPPELHTIRADWSPTDGARVEEFGDGVFYITNLKTGLHMMFVEFTTYVVVIDAPTGLPLLTELPAGNAAPGMGEGGLSKHAIRLIRNTVGDKPIKYLVITHFHSDRAGGLFAFADQRMRVLAEASEIEPIESFLDSTHTLCGVDPQQARFTLQAVEGRKVMTDTTQRVEILDVGENPHTQHMLVAWMPRARVLYASDLLTGRGGVPDEQFDKLNRHFLEWVKRQNLKPRVILTARGDGPVYYPLPEDSGNARQLISSKDP